MTITVMYAEANQPVVTDTLEGARIIKPRAGGAEGTDPLTVKFDLDLTRISVEWRPDVHAYERGITHGARREGD